MKGYDATVYLPSEYKDTGAVSADCDKGILRRERESKVTIDYSFGKTQIDQKIDAMIRHVENKSLSLSPKRSNAEIVYNINNDQKYHLDLTPKGEGTYYVNITKDLYPAIGSQAEKLIVSIKDGQRVIFNVDCQALNVNKIKVNEKGSDDDSVLNHANPITKQIIWNFYNAKDLTINGSITGVVLAPNAAVTVNGTSSGWLVANQVNIGSGEWHDTYEVPPTPEVTVTPTPTPEVTETPTPTPSGTPTPTPSGTPTPTPSGTPTPTPSGTPTPTPSGTPTPTPEGTVTPTPTPEGTVTPMPTPSGTVTPTPTPEGTVTPTPMATATPSVFSTPTPSVGNANTTQTARRTHLVHTGAVKTGDTSNVAAEAVAAVFSVICTAVLIRRKRDERRDKKNNR